MTQLTQGHQGVVVLNNTPFYAEGGGQVGDVGTLSVTGGVDALFDVTDTQKIQAAVFGHHGVLARGTLTVGDTVTATVDHHARHATVRNHSATHLLHSALRRVLGSHVQQKGSLVNPDRARFDFAHSHGMTPVDLVEVERLVNHAILANTPVTATLMNQEDALKSGAARS